MTPDQEEVSIHLKADGLANAKDEDGKDYAGHWRVVDNRIMLSIGGEDLTGEMSGDGRLILWADGDEDERVIFQRVK